MLDIKFVVENKEFVIQRVAANKDAVSFKIILKKG